MKTFIIYKIFKKNTLDDHMVYIGKTSYYMDICWKLHIKAYNNSNDPLHSSKLYNFIRDNGGIHEFTYLILEEIPNISKSDINVLHNSYIDQFDALNKLNSSKNSLIPFSKNDPDSIKLYNKNYYENNRSRIERNSTKKITCHVCGRSVQAAHLSNHLTRPICLRAVSNAVSNIT